MDISTPGLRFPKSKIDPKMSVLPEIKYEFWLVNDHQRLCTHGFIHVPPHTIWTYPQQVSGVTYRSIGLQTLE